MGRVEAGRQRGAISIIQVQDDGGSGGALASHLFHGEPQLTQWCCEVKAKGSWEYPLGQYRQPEFLDFWRSLTGSYMSTPLKETFWKVAQARTPSIFATSWICITLALYADQKSDACL